jgi:hypothetical protein
MTRHRLARLRLLAQGAALVSAGAAAAACNKDQPPNINAPPDPTVHANATVQPEHLNAPPSASAPTAPPEATASGGKAPTTTPARPPHVNAPPKPR